MVKASKLSVCAVIVTYFPESPTLKRLIEAVVDQVDAIVLIDNTGGQELDDLWEGLHDLVHLIRQPRNIGLASAQNIGISWAREHGFGFVLLLDQDSYPAEDMVVRLVLAYHSRKDGAEIAAVGPAFRDPREGRYSPFIRIGFPVSRKLWCKGADVIVCDFLISSGSLIPLDVLNDVGGMDESLFIDNVDLEWCFRACQKGYVLLGACGATMHHRLGDERISLPFTAKKSIVVHGPVRLYYMMRNRIHLYKQDYTPRIWIAQDMPRVLAKFLLFGVLVRPRLRNLRYMWRGILDGIRGRGGACPF